MKRINTEKKEKKIISKDTLFTSIPIKFFKAFVDYTCSVSMNSFLTLITQYHNNYWTKKKIVISTPHTGLIQCTTEVSWNRKNGHSYFVATNRSHYQFFSVYIQPICRLDCAENRIMTKFVFNGFSSEKKRRKNDIFGENMCFMCAAHTDRPL